jgi:hypothetical protein
MQDATPVPSTDGLCATCRHLREIVSGKGARFLYCLLSETDERYPKYPRIPVLQCSGYCARPPAPSTE